MVALLRALFLSLGTGAALLQQPNRTMRSIKNVLGHGHNSIRLCKNSGPLSPQACFGEYPIVLFNERGSAQGSGDISQVGPLPTSMLVDFVLNRRGCVCFLLLRTPNEKSCFGYVASASELSFRMSSRKYMALLQKSELTIFAQEGGGPVAVLILPQTTCLASSQ